eukprot:TRINITY_DN10149_c0_g1_i2.p1 TRINITY_DN10149_c0_g1~~TRINITY_DN10149_c0_g1_i2.p1  ORF type:complete len:182 (-),score=58.54 TRINITY_DN10149_c0_g1_i2:199-711(-)
MLENVAILTLSFVLLPTISASPEKDQHGFGEALTLLEDLESRINNLDLTKMEAQNHPVEIRDLGNQEREVYRWLKLFNKRSSPPAPGCVCPAASETPQERVDGDRLNKKEFLDSEADMKESNLLKLIGTSLKARLNRMNNMQVNSHPFYNTMFFRPSAAKVEHLIKSVGK